MSCECTPKCTCDCIPCALKNDHLVDQLQDSPFQAISIGVAAADIEELRSKIQREYSKVYAWMTQDERFMAQAALRELNSLVASMQKRARS